MITDYRKENSEHLTMTGELNNSINNSLKHELDIIQSSINRIFVSDDVEEITRQLKFVSDKIYLLATARIGAITADLEIK